VAQNETLYIPFPTKVARIEPKSLAQNEPKRIGPQTKSGTDQTEMPGTITPKWVAQNEPKYPHLAYELRDTNFKINAVCPGLTATDFTYGNGGDVETAAKRVVKYATIDQYGPTGKFFSEETNPETEEIAW